jgi:hypothetical protein
MRLAIHECKHCGEEYTHQWSGNYDAVDTPKEYRDQEYCPECKKAIVCALITIPVKYAYKPVKTDEVDLDTLLRWEKENIEEKLKEYENSPCFFPNIKRVFARAYSEERKEYQCIEQVIGREDKSGRIYVYSYWPSDKSNYTTTVQRRVNLQTGEPGKYKLQS